MKKRSLCWLFFAVAAMVSLAAVAYAKGKPEIISHDAKYLNNAVSVNVQWQSSYPVVSVKVHAGAEQKDIAVDEYDNRRNPDGYTGEVSVVVSVTPQYGDQFVTYVVQLQDEYRQRSNPVSGKIKIGVQAKRDHDDWGKDKLEQKSLSGQQGQSGDIMDKLVGVMARHDTPPTLDEVTVSRAGMNGVSFSTKANDDKGLREITFRIYDAAGSKVQEQILSASGKVWQGSSQTFTIGPGSYRVVVQAVDNTGNTSQERSGNFSIAGLPGTQPQPPPVTPPVTPPVVIPPVVQPPVTPPEIPVTPPVVVPPVVIPPVVQPPVTPPEIPVTPPVVVPPVVTPPVDPPGYSWTSRVHMPADFPGMEVNADRPGLDYRSFDLPASDPNLCKNACDGEPNCKAFTFVGQGVQGHNARCWLKSSVPNPVKNTCCVSGVKTTPPIVQPPLGTGMEVDTDRPGLDYRSFDLPSADPNLCKNACAGEPNCKAFTYVRPGVQGPNARCWLKSSVPNPVKSNCCVSGVKTTTPVTQQNLPSVSDPVIYTNGNIAGVQNNPTRETTFTLTASHRITFMYDYHYFNNGKLPGTISLRHSDGTVYGPWQSEGALGQGGVLNAYWFVRPNVEIKAGTYTVIDSDKATWSQNSGSSGAGFVEIRGIKTGTTTTPPTTVTPPPSVTLPTGAELVTQPNLRDGLRGWTIQDWMKASDGKGEVISDSNGVAFRGTKENSRIGIMQSLNNLNVATYGKIILTAQIRTDQQQLDGTGWQGREAPVGVFVTYTDVNGVLHNILPIMPSESQTNRMFWEGFYHVDPTGNSRNWHGTKVGKGQWYTYQYDLMTLNPRPKVLHYVGAEGAGWPTREGRIAIFSLRGQAAVAPPVPPIPLPSVSDPVIYTNGNIAGVQNNPTRETTFTLSASHRITFIYTYHYFNNGKLPGTVALRHSDGTVYGPWQTAGALGQGGVLNAYWFVKPNVEIKAGSYTVIDSDKATWSQNSGSSGAGFVEIRGIKTGTTTTPPTTVTPPPSVTLPTGAELVTQPNLRDGLRGWTIQDWMKASDGKGEVSSDSNGVTFRGTKENSRIGIMQSLNNLNVSTYGKIILTAQIRTEEQKLDGTGWQGREASVGVFVTYTDVNGLVHNILPIMPSESQTNRMFWEGFYHVDPTGNSRNWHGTKVGKGQWYTYQYDLMTLNPRPKVLHYVGAEGAGWPTREGRIVLFSLRGQAAVAPPVPPIPLPSVSDPVIYTNGNIAGVQNNPTRETTFTLNASHRITFIYTYHYFNNGKLPGTVALRHSDGTVYGPWQTAGALGQGGVLNAYWFVKPNVEIKAGSYTVVDSDKATWSQNSGSSGAGFVEIRGIKTGTPPVVGVKELLTNGSLSSLSGWTIHRWMQPTGDRGEVTQDKDGIRFRNTSGNTRMGIMQTFNADVSGAQKLILKAVVRAVEQTLDGTGWQGREAPVAVMVTYTDVNGVVRNGLGSMANPVESQANRMFWHGFYYKNPTGNSRDWNGTKVGQGSWYTYEVDLMSLNPKPKVIHAVGAEGSGWPTREGKIASISLQYSGPLSAAK